MVGLNGVTTAVKDSLQYTSFDHEREFFTIQAGHTSFRAIFAKSDIASVSGFLADLASRMDQISRAFGTMVASYVKSLEPFAAQHAEARKAFSIRFEPTFPHLSPAKSRHRSFILNAGTRIESLSPPLESRDFFFVRYFGSLGYIHTATEERTQSSLPFASRHNCKTRSILKAT
jgi:hypothetical protein